MPVLDLPVGVLVLLRQHFRDFLVGLLAVERRVQPPGCTSKPAANANGGPDASGGEGSGPANANRLCRQPRCCFFMPSAIGHLIPDRKDGKARLPVSAAELPHLETNS